MVKTAVVFKVLDSKAACIFENGTVAEKRGPLSWEKVLYF